MPATVSAELKSEASFNQMAVSGQTRNPVARNVSHTEATLGRHQLAVNRQASLLVGTRPVRDP